MSAWGTNLPVDWYVDERWTPSLDGGWEAPVFEVRESYGERTLIAVCDSREMAHLVLDARRDQLRVARFEGLTGYAL